MPSQRADLPLNFTLAGLDSSQQSYNAIEARQRGAVGTARFRDAPKALITNARCLTEGIDVPAVDMVAFIDPRHSKIDIAQATGRAMRKPGGSDKEVGYVVVPLFLERKSGETVEEALERSDFADVANVLNAMQEQDLDLVQIIRELKEASGREEIFDPRRLSEKIEILGPSVELSTLQSNIYAEIVSAIGVSWDEWYGRLLKFREAYHHCLVPASHGDGTLSNWCEKNRAKKKAGTLKIERERALNEIGFDWSPRETRWQLMYERLKQYRAAHGHCCPPRSADDRELTNWVFEQRFASASGRLSKERKHQLDELGFVFDVREASWLEQYYQLRSFYQRHGHVDVPESPDTTKLVSWIRIQRMKYNRGKLEEHKVEMLNELGMSWAPHKEAWDMTFARLQKKYESGRFGSDDRDSQWIQKQRAKYRKGTLEKDKIKKFESLGISWEPDEQFWSSMYEKLASCVDENGKSHISYDHSDKQLFNWATNQRALKRRGLLSFDRITKLDAIGFVWNPVHPANRRQTRVRRDHPE